MPIPTPHLRISTVCPLHTKRVVQGTQECVVDHALAKRLECERYLRFLRFSNVRTNPTDNGKPVVWTAVLCERRLLPSAGFGSVKSVGSSFHTDRERIRRKVSWSRPEDFRRSPSCRSRNVSGCSGRLTLLRILRHYMGIKRNILEISESYHPGDRYALTMNMRANRWLLNW